MQMAWVAVFLEVVEVVVKRVLVRFLVQGLEMNPASHVSVGHLPPGPFLET